LQGIRQNAVILGDYMLYPSLDWRQYCHEEHEGEDEPELENQIENVVPPWFAKIRPGCEVAADAKAKI
jgi:hypothetical protein